VGGTVKVFQVGRASCAPWRVGENPKSFTIPDSQGHIIARVQSAEGRREMDRANAALMADAPVLLQASKNWPVQYAEQAAQAERLSAMLAAREEVHAAWKRNVLRALQEVLETHVKTCRRCQDVGSTALCREWEKLTALQALVEVGDRK